MDMYDLDGIPTEIDDTDYEDMYNHSVIGRLDKLEAEIVLLSEVLNSILRELNQEKDSARTGYGKL